MSQDKRDALAILGARVIITRNAPPDSPDNFQNVARRLALENGWFLTDQFENLANPRVHERTTGPEIFEQTAGHLGAFVAGVGTGGTLTGVGRYLKQRDPTIRIILADPAGSGLAGWVERRQLGPDASYQVEGIGSSRVPGTFDASVVDAAEIITDLDSFQMTRRLLTEEGLLVGGSAGTAVAAAVRIAARADDRRPVVVLLPDAWDRYRSKPWMQAFRDRNSAE
jgi:cysteine synthase